MVLGVLTGWLDRREREAVAYLIEENRLLRRQLGTGRPHYHQERNHQGLDNRLIAGTPVIDITSRVQRRPRLCGLLNFYERAA